MGDFLGFLESTYFGFDPLENFDFLTKKLANYFTKIKLGDPVQEHYEAPIPGEIPANVSRVPKVRIGSSLSGDWLILVLALSYFSWSSAEYIFQVGNIAIFGRFS